jgi:hypothetical protein
LSPTKKCLTPLELEDMASALEASGNYLIKRRLKPRPAVAAPSGISIKRALFVDVETTGLDFERDEIIELAIVPFQFGPDGQIYSVGEPFQSFRQPSNPIPSIISKLTGITNEMVAGHSINIAELDAFVADAHLVVAHNAAFDRRFVERLASSFQNSAWACSQSQIDWAAEGYEGTRLCEATTTYQRLAKKLAEFRRGLRFAVQDTCLRKGSARRNVRALNYDVAPALCARDCVVKQASLSPSIGRFR